MIAPVTPRLHTQTPVTRSKRPLLKIDHVDKNFKRGSVVTEVLKDVSLTVETGEFISTSPQN